MFILLMHLLSHLHLHSEEMGDKLKWKVLHPSCLFFFSFNLIKLHSEFTRSARGGPKPEEHHKNF